MTTPHRCSVSSSAGCSHTAGIACARWLHWADWCIQRLNALQPLAALLARAYVANVFFMSGLTKLRDWSVTLELFTYEYQVPLLPPPVAAVLGTGGELILPVLLVLGLGGRLAALGLSAVNAVAVLSLPDMPEAAFQLHVFWGALLAGVAVYGPGVWSVDAVVRHWLAGKHGGPCRAAKP